MKSGVAALACAATVGVTNSASADLFAFEESGPFTVQPEDRSDIVFSSISSTFDSDTNVLSWEATFEPNSSPSPGNTPEDTLPEGFVLVINDGPMPKGNVNQLAVVYFDADTDPANPIATVYGYNGAESATSHFQGVSDMFVDPAPGPVQIASSLNDPSLLIEGSTTDNPDGTRTLRMVIDATTINEFVPADPAVNLPGGEPLEGGYFGIGYSTSIGVWFHPFVTTSAQYGDDGFLLPTIDGWNAARADFGFFDESDLEAQLVPEPTTALLTLAGGTLFLARRRKA
ncbi:MAG: PEP-CTERM sorting domain-containing protein [Planctomycetota bacterium]